MLRAIIFDYNGVLVDDLTVHEDAYLFAAKKYGFPLTRKTASCYISYAPDRKRSLYFGEISDEMWRRIFQAKTECYFRMASERNLVFPDVETVLTSLSKKYMLAVLSNTTRSYFEDIFPSQLSCLFQETLFAGEVSEPKPFPAPLREITARLKISKEQCCYVGDSLVDMQMSKAAGISVYGVATGHNAMDELREAGAVDVFSSLTELERRLDAKGDS